jgi:putative nucleotidyltransferase with HDIG domain
MSASNTALKWGDVPDWFYPAAEALMRALKVADPETYHHCLRVGEMARKLARESSLSEYEQKIALFSGMFHDIGKMGIDKAILYKPSHLDPKEKKIVEDHPLMSVEILNPLAYHSFVKNLIPGVRHHHERIDGLGYPDKLVDDEIPLTARLVMVVDTFDAMSQNRVYRKGLPTDIIYDELKRYSGIQFDPQLVKIFLDAHKTWKQADTDLEVSALITRKIA